MDHDKTQQEADSQPPAPLGVMRGDYFGGIMTGTELSKKIYEKVAELNLLIIKADQIGLEIHYIVDRKTLTNKNPMFAIRVLKEI